jgi:SulP family sulfate permease
LIDYRSFIRTWRYNGLDGFSQTATFAAVIALGVELGIMIGAALAIALYLWRTSRPHMAVVGRVGETEHFRNILRHEVKTLPHVLALRVDKTSISPTVNISRNICSPPSPTTAASSIWC